MTDTHNTSGTQRESTIREPSKYNVVIYNNEGMGAELLLNILCNIFRMDNDKAEKTMMRICNEGEAVAGTYYKDIAESKLLLTLAHVKSEGISLKITVRKA